MKLIGLCGRSGSGKSTVAAVFRKCGIHVIDADKISRDVTVSGSVCLSELCEAFGSGILLPDGNLDRKKLAAAAMSDSASVAKLNEITHRHIVAAILKEAEDYAICVVDAPLLFEARLNEKCDKTVCVIANDDACLSRASARDSVEAETVRKRLLRQKTNEFLKEHCDITIENNGTVCELEAKAKDAAITITGGKCDAQ